MDYKRDLKNNEQMLHFHHIVRRLTIFFTHTLNKYLTIQQWEHHTHHVQNTIDFLQETIQSRSHGEEYSPNNLILA